MLHKRAQKAMRTLVKGGTTSTSLQRSVFTLLCKSHMSVRYVAIKKSSQVSMEMMRSKVTQPKWPYLIIKDKVSALPKG